MSKKLIEHYNRYNAKVILYPEGTSNLNDLFQLGIIPKVVDTNAEMDNLYDATNAIETINSTLNLIGDKHVGRWCYFHYDLLTLLNDFGLDECLDNEVCGEYIYEATIEHIHEVLKSPIIKFFDKEYISFIALMEKESWSEVLLADFTGDLTMKGLSIRKIMDIFKRCKNNKEEILNNFNIMKNIQEF